MVFRGVSGEKTYEVNLEFFKDVDPKDEVRGAVSPPYSRLRHS